MSLCSWLAVAGRVVIEILLVLILLVLVAAFFPTFAVIAVCIGAGYIGLLLAAHLLGAMVGGGLKCFREAPQLMRNAFNHWLLLLAAPVALPRYWYLKVRGELASGERSSGVWAGVVVVGAVLAGFLMFFYAMMFLSAGVILLTLGVIGAMQLSR